MGTVNAAIEWIQAKMRVLEGVRKATEAPPDKIGADMTVIAYTPSGSVRPGAPARARTDFHTVHIDLMIPFKNLARDYTRLSPYIEKMATVICSDLTWGGTVETIGAQNLDVDRTLGPDVWGDSPVMRLRFIVQIKIVQV
ncbi:MAG: hypothetical protein GY841_10415 [FCB group bacterium]|nr:hypothetical protein [FCB group bacterium]